MAKKKTAAQEALESAMGIPPVADTTPVEATTPVADTTPVAEQEGEQDDAIGCPDSYGWRIGTVSYEAAMAKRDEVNKAVTAYNKGKKPEERHGLVRTVKVWGDGDASDTLLGFTLTDTPKPLYFKDRVLVHLKKEEAKTVCDSINKAIETDSGSNYANIREIHASDWIKDKDGRDVPVAWVIARNEESALSLWAEHFRLYSKCESESGPKVKPVDKAVSILSKLSATDLAGAMEALKALMAQQAAS